MDDNYFFDNLVVSSSEEEAARVRDETWAPKKAVEVGWWVGVGVGWLMCEATWALKQAVEVGWWVGVGVGVWEAWAAGQQVGAHVVSTRPSRSSTTPHPPPAPLAPQAAAEEAEKAKKAEEDKAEGKKEGGAAGGGVLDTVQRLVGQAFDSPALEPYADTLQPLRDFLEANPAAAVALGVAPLLLLVLLLTGGKKKKVCSRGVGWGGGRGWVGSGEGAS